jgi:transcriptional antiterminator RfaH
LILLAVIATIPRSLSNRSLRELSDMAIESSSHAWYLVQCKPRQNFRALENLERQGFTCFHPEISLQKVVRKELVDVREPLFPGYLFIQLDQVNDNWAPIRSTRGVNRIVRFNDGLPLAVSDSLIDDLRQRCQRGTEIAFAAGDRVALTEGPFADLEAIFDCWEGEKRVVILLNLLQRQQRIAVPANLLRKIN